MSAPSIAFDPHVVGCNPLAAEYRLAGVRRASPSCAQAVRR